jgi:hypothetical protein
MGMHLNYFYWNVVQSWKQKNCSWMLSHGTPQVHQKAGGQGIAPLSLASTFACFTFSYPQVRFLLIKGFWNNKSLRKTNRKLKYTKE